MSPEHSESGWKSNPGGSSFAIDEGKDWKQNVIRSVKVHDDKREENIHQDYGLQQGQVDDIECLCWASASNSRVGEEI